MIRLCGTRTKEAGDYSSGWYDECCPDRPSEIDFHLGVVEIIGGNFGENGGCLACLGCGVENRRSRKVFLALLV